MVVVVVVIINDIYYNILIIYNNCNDNSWGINIHEKTNIFFADKDDGKVIGQCCRARSDSCII